MATDIKGMNGSLDGLSNSHFKSKVVAPKNPKLIKEPIKAQKFSPSQFLKEMSMNTKEKLASTHEMHIPQIIELLDMGETSLQKSTTLAVDEPMFQPFPSEIYFQKYEKFTTYEVPLLLRNNDKVPRLVKVTQVDTPYFKIISPPDSHQKVGPGLPVIFTIQFTPEDNKDYNHELIVSTEREKFAIPIKCIGARAILDFPDEINFSMGPVKFLNTKVLLVRNIGNKDAKFALKAEKPFKVTPDHGILPIGENMQVTIDFQPLKCGDFEKELVICYDSNESIHVKLHGAAQDSNVRLDKNSIRIEDTYITMTNQRTVTIHNRSDIIVHYEWKKYATIEEEEQQKLKTITILNREEENAKNKIIDQSADYLALLSRNFKNKIKHAESNSYFFEDEVFFIQPIEGDIWPNSTIDVNIIFKPDFAQTYNRVAFCEITGRESRLPLRLCGIGCGPKVQLSIENLDVGNIFIGSTHVYEVTMHNRGFIDAIYSISMPNTGFGKCFMFEPNESLISPNGYQAIRITFKSNKLGEFRETFEFAIDGKPEKCPLVISGVVIAPTFNFDKPKLKFGLVSFGFKYVEECYLFNTSLVPMKFELKVLSDSEATRSFDGDFSNFDTSNFKEFSVTPKTGTIPPQSEMKILVEFIPHFIKKYETSLAVDIVDVGQEFFLLPISARSTVPTISLMTNTIDMGRCFIYHNYKRVIKLSNETSLNARYFIMPSHSDNPFKFQSLQSEGIIEQKSIKEITISVEALKLGYITGDLFIKINGSVEPPLKCTFTCLCQGPVVHIVDQELDWGLTPLLQDVSKEILLSNESLIAAKYTTSMAERNSPWRLEPAEGVIAAGSEFILNAICHLADKKSEYNDTVIINVEHSFPKEVKVRAQGVGSSIVSEPNIGHLIDFGTHFSGGSVKKVFTLTNMSSRTHNLSFHPEGRNVTSINKKEFAKEKDLPPLQFKITPHRVDLLPGESKEITVEGCSEKAQLIEEIFTCQAIIGKSSGKDRIMKFKIRCEFIEPLVSFSKREIEFRCERDGPELPKSQTGIVVLSNVSSLALTSRISTSIPFSILNEQTNEFVPEIIANIKTGESRQLTINFDPSFKKDFHNEIINGLLNINYIEHQHNDFVNLKAEVFFPNIHLESNLIDFECVLNNTETVRNINMTNIGPLPVNYKWSFIIDESTFIERMTSNNVLQKSIEVYPNENETKPLEQLYDAESPTKAQETPKIEIVKSSEDKTNNEEAEKQVNADTLVSNSASDIMDLMNQQNKDMSKKGLNQRLEQLVNQDTLTELPSFEELFDISPIYGHLSPGESQKLTITFFGHKEIRAYAKAICQVENGPEYEMILKGEASVLSYEISTHLLDFGHVPYDQVTEAAIMVKNTGKVRLHFNDIGFDAQNGVIEQEKPLLAPSRGSIEPDQEQIITIKYLPGIPEKFEKKILFQIAHFPPDEIIIQGEASFADIILDIPRLETDEYKNLLETVKGVSKVKSDRPKIDIHESRIFASSPDFDVEAEVDRLAIQNFVKQQQQTQFIKSATSESLAEIQKKTLQSRDSNTKEIPPLDMQNMEYTDRNHIIQTAHSSIPQTAQSNPSTGSRASDTKSSAKKKFKPKLPDYLLDFGHVILGTVKTQTIRAANMGEISASFEIERQNFSKSGFVIDVEKVKNLPNQESIEFLVTFDPRGANLPLGPVEHVIPINIINGPILHLRLRANVTMPDLQISNDVVEFNEVKCGECKIITVQIHNHKEVRCDWSASYLPNKDEKFTPLHLKRKKKLTGEPNKPHIFEIMPPSGTMFPGQKVNIQIKFMPTEEKAYEERVTIRMQQSSQRLMVLCKGRGLEPRIEFSKTLLEFEPILPHSVGDEQEIKIMNPCTFPIEIYNLEFDKNYLDEEEILRTIRGYDEYNTILLPPRNVNEKLPAELQDFYEEQQKKQKEDEKKRQEEENAEISPNAEEEQGGTNQKQDSPTTSARQPQQQVMNVSVDLDKAKAKAEEKKPNEQPNGGELDKNPVYESIARYLGIDLSIEGRAARNRRGVAIIVHGAPLTGKTKAAAALAKYYECPMLSIDSIITDAVANWKSPAAIKARQLCAEVATKHAEEQKLLEGANQNAGITGGASVSTGATGLSAEALAQHSLIQGSVAMSKKTSVAGDSHTKSKKKADTSDLIPAQPTSPPPLLAPIPRKLSISANAFTQDDGYMSTILPEDVVVDLLNERFQLPDCSKGIIIDGLDTLFCQNHLHAATAVLKAFNNRRYIYCFTFKSDFQKYKENMNKIQEEKMKQKKEKEELERIELEEMDDESYENLPEERRKEIDIKLLHTKKLRLKREAEEKAAEMERRERELAEQQAKLEEEKKKKKKPGATPAGSIDKKSTTTTAPNAPAKLQPAQTSKDKQSSLQIPNNQSNERPHTRSDNPEDSDTKLKRKRLDSSSKIGQFSGEDEQSKDKLIDPEEEKRKEAERAVQQKFKTFDLFYKDVSQLFDTWDRTQGTIYRQPSPSDKSDHEDHLAVKKTLKKQDKSVKGKEKAQEKAEVKDVPETKEKQATIDENDKENDHQANAADEKKLDDKKEDGIGITHIIYDNLGKVKLEEIYKHPKLPQLAEVLDGMGLGPRGPPIPPPTTFAVTPYPAVRKAPPCIEFGHYVFVTTNENDPNLISDEKPKEVQPLAETIAEEEKVPEPSSSKLDKTKKGGRGSRAESKTETAAPRKTSGDKKKDTKGRRESNTQSPVNDGSKFNTQSDNVDGGTSIDSSALDKPSQKLQRFRWCIPAQGELVIRLRFTSEETGQYDQTLNFEIVGTRRRYQLFCRGICAFPTISREPRIVFVNRKKNRVKDEVVSKKFILNEEVYEFGPLLVGNNKERCKEGKFPEYQETLVIANASPMEAEVSFCFLEDNVEKTDVCFFLEPTDMVLKPNETKQLKVFATPKEIKHYEDSLICCIKENPEPAIFKFSCHGQKPELQLDKKEFFFKQVLLHRKDSREIKMLNTTMIPVQWRLEGVDLLGDEFVCNQTNGIIEPNGTFNLVLHFRALKPLNITSKDKKALKLLVSDVNGFLGFMENHTINVMAEAYDVALEINLPKGNDGGLEFGTIRVNSENKQICNLKNKGKYNIKYNFLIEPNGADSEEIRKCITVSPASGELQSIHDRNAQHHQVQVIVNTKKELSVKDLPILKCQITEPQANEGTVIANIPIKISFKAVYSKFNIIPQSEINFGVMNVNSKRQEKIIIENKGDFDFKFTITKFYRESVKLPKSTNPKDDKSKQREGSSQTKTTTKRNDSVRDGGVTQGRFQVGIYTITPAYGLILQGGHQAITIDCAPETSGKFDEELVIDITDRDTSLFPNGQIYRLLAEATIPSVAVSPDIFEEHTIIPNMSVLDQKTMGIGIYCEEENRFVFNNVVVGRTAKARFKLYNSNKIPIDLTLLLRTTNRNVKSGHEVVFDLEPQRLQIQPYCYSFATVSFTPQAMMSYNSVFEATLESSSNNVKNKSITFELVGEGNLPRFSVSKPTLRNKKGQYLMLFKRSVVSHVDYQHLTLTNDGTLPTKVNFSLNDPDSVFKIKPNYDLNKKNDVNAVVLRDNGEAVSSIVMQPNQQISFIVSCTPKNVQNYEGTLQLTVTDNQFEDTIIQLVGEGYLEDVTMDNLHSLNNVEFEEEIIADEEVSAVKSNSINFGDIYINDSKQILFTMTNRNKTTCYRFEWPENNAITFSPKIGHLHAGCAKDITVTFKSSESKYMKKELINCALTKISFDAPANEVKDWDDRMTVIKWINEIIQPQPPAIDINRPSSAATSSVTTIPNPKPQTIRKKVIETEPEPHFVKIDDNTQPMELYISANCDYSRYKCSGHAVRFKDTLMFQTRVYEVSILNRGKIQFDYNWRVAMEDKRRPFTPLIEPDTPTPEPSPSPRGRSKNKGETSVSPPRKAGKDIKETAVKKDSKDSKDAKPPAGKKAASASLEDTVKSVKGSKKSKDKETKDSEDAPTSRKDTITMDSIDIPKPPEDALRPESQAQLRAESALSYQAPSIMTESGYIPFSVEPAFGKIEPGKTQVFKIKFAPLNVNDYQARLTCLIPNLEENKPGPVIAVKGRSMLPYCHFDLEESDYISSGRRNPELPGPGGAASGLSLDSMTKVIEFKSVGLSTKCVKQFNIINPTNADYTFEWIKDDQYEIQKRGVFTCLVEKGELKSGRRQEITFEFFPNEIGVHETFWQFKIPQYDLSIPFLLVGEVTEPKVVFDRSYVLFKPLLLGMTGREIVHIINQENKQFKFSFDTNSCYNEGRSSVVLVEPANGTVEPLARIPITLTMTPHEQRQLVFNLKCMLSNSSKPISLNVKGEGFCMQSNLYCEDSNGVKIEFSEGNINEIHFGEVEKNEISYRNLFILNTGKFAIDFDCYLNSEFEDALNCFSVEPQKGYIEPGQKHQCVLRYHAKKEKPTIASLIVKVDHGPVYHVHIDGIAVKPDIKFSFTEYNFGPCFIYKAGMPVQTAKLNILNAGLKETNVDCLFNNSNAKSAFSIDFKQTILMPKESTNVIISFVPRECKNYTEKVVFELNGLTKREVNLRGVGTDMKVELVDIKQKLLDIGTLEIGKSSKKIVKVINKSMAFIEFNLLYEPKSEILAQDRSILQVQPSQNIKLNSNQALDLQVIFNPKLRIPKFYEEIKLEYNGICVPLFAINGACHGYNIWVESNALPFGAVVQKCSTTKRFVMHNDGDIGATFRWEVEKLKPDFSIQPAYGYISPGMEVNFDVTFSPSEISPDIRKDNIKCLLEGCSPISMSFTGSCIQVVPQKEFQHFETFVRQKEVKQISLVNKTNSVWDIKPVIEGDYFSGIEAFLIEPQSSKSYDITYAPLTMTLDGKRHTGSCFFPLPDGTGLLYNLTGISGPPKPAGKITRDVPCKVSATELLVIENWLKKPQRFKVIYDLVKPDKPDPSTTIKGHEYVDVPGNGKKEYKVNYFAHKEGLTQVKVTFKNEQTGEYLFYELAFKAVRGSSVGSIDLATPVRLPISYSLKLENPLPSAVSFTASCNNNTEILIPAGLQITAKGQGDFNFEYLPLKVGEMNARLELVSGDLGICTYDLNLKALPAPQERPLYFKTTLGSSQTITAKFVNFCKVKTDYACKIDNSDFKTDKNITAAPSQTPSGMEVAFDIIFEPSNLGEIKSVMTLSSPIGGDYVFPLFGTCLPPKPQGPYIIKANGNTSIQFKNVFSSQLQYTFAIDNPLFYVTKATDTIKPHQTYKIIVGFDGNDSANKADVMGKLIVSPPKLAGLNSNVQWIYYLKGVTA